MKRLMWIICVTACVLAGMGPDSAYARKYIIILCDHINPIGELSDNGRQVVIHNEGDVVHGTPGHRTEVLLTVYQEQTDAFAMNIRHSPVPGDVNDFPDGRIAVDITARTVGPNRFVEGWAVAMYVEQEFQGDELIREWSRTQDVLLLYEP